MEDGEIETRDMAEVLSDILAGFLAGGADVVIAVHVHVHPASTGPLADCPACAMGYACEACPAEVEAAVSCEGCVYLGGCNRDPATCAAKELPINHGVTVVAVPNGLGD